ncbi:MAG: cytochrome d ubiquinol oxidase subunit II, partial [Phycisphaerales bacterium]
MVEAWFIILWFTLTTYMILDGRTFGAGALLHVVATTDEERRQVIGAIGPLWPWGEVWLIAAGGTLFVAFPRVLGVAFSGYYLALFLVLWALIFRSMSLEVRGAVDHPLWRSFWNFTLVVSSLALALLFGVAMGNLLRGVPLDASQEFQMAFFTSFGVRGHVGLLDWYTVSVGLASTLVLGAFGATMLVHKTDGPVHERSRRAAAWLWAAGSVMLAVIAVESWFVRPSLLTALPGRPLAWLSLFACIAGAVCIYSGLRRSDLKSESRGVVGAAIFLYGLSGSWAA